MRNVRAASVSCHVLVTAVCKCYISDSKSQIMAVEDTWHWNLGAEATYKELIGEPGQVGRMIEAFCSFIGDNKMVDHYG